jgi:hypothetical protein
VSVCVCACVRGQQTRTHGDAKRLVLKGWLEHAGVPWGAQSGAHAAARQASKRVIEAPLTVCVCVVCSLACPCLVCLLAVMHAAARLCQSPCCAAAHTMHARCGGVGECAAACAGAAASPAASYLPHFERCIARSSRVVVRVCAPRALASSTLTGPCLGRPLLGGLQPTPWPLPAMQPILCHCTPVVPRVWRAMA